MQGRVVESLKKPYLAFEKSAGTSSRLLSVKTRGDIPVTCLRILSSAKASAKPFGPLQHNIRTMNWQRVK